VVTPIFGRSVAWAEMFVGRGAEVEQVLAGLAPDTATASAPMVVSAVAGMGGVGKTALTCHAATVAVERRWFTHAVIVDMQGYAPDSRVEAAHVFAPLLRALHVPAAEIPSTLSEQAVLYRQVLRQFAEQQQRVLVVLDNASSTDQVRDLLPGLHAHRVVITTRDTLALPCTRRLSLGVLPTSDCVTLLDQAVRQHRPNDDRVACNHACTERLAEACGQLPLELRIAAGILADDLTMDVASLADELRQAAIPAFTHGDSAVAATFDLSRQRLITRAPDAAHLLLLLALAPGPDLGTEAVAALAGYPVGRVRPLLRVLHQAHLVQRDGGRWRLHDLIRRYLRDLLPGDVVGDIDTAFDRLLDHYLRIATEADRWLDGSARQNSGVFARLHDAEAWLETERPNLVAAVLVAVSSGRYPRVTKLAAVLNEFLGRRRHLDDRVTVNRLALTAARRLHDPTDIAKALTHLGSSLRAIRQLDEAIEAHREALALFEDHGDYYRAASVSSNLGAALGDQAQYDEAIAAHRKTISFMNHVGDRRGEGMAWNNLGVVLRHARRFHEAIEAHRNDLAICRELGDLRGEGMAWNNLGTALGEAGELDDAIDAHQKGIAILREYRDRPEEGLAWTNLGIAFRKAKRLTEAAEAHQASIAISQETKERHREGDAWFNLGLVYQDMRRLDDVHRCWLQTFEAFQESNDTDGVRKILPELIRIRIKIRQSNS
jgi:tetratricopeptide (TPR) repeat protein